MKAQFYTLRHKESGQHLGNDLVWTQDIDEMYTPTDIKEALERLDSLFDHYDRDSIVVCTWTMEWNDKK
jgi:hypothetical protein